MEAKANAITDELAKAQQKITITQMRTDHAQGQRLFEVEQQALVMMGLLLNVGDAIRDLRERVEALEERD